MAEVTSARLSSGVSATLSGGPITLLGASSSAMTLGFDDLRSMMLTVSAGGLATTVFTPFMRTSLLSFADTAISACEADVAAAAHEATTMLAQAAGLLHLLVSR